MKIVQRMLQRGHLVRAAASRSCRVAPRLGSQRPIDFLQPENSPISASFPIRSMSSSSQSELLDILAREEQEELDSGNMELPQELADLKATLENDWRIVDNDGAMTQLFSRFKKVQISFHCQDTVETEGDVFDEADEEEPSPAVRFTVTVSKAGKTLVASCISEFGEGKIETVATTTSTPDVVHANQGAVEKGDYQGPDFSELAEDLRDVFGDYFAELGVTSDVAAFVAMYTDYKEQLQYVQFLRDAQSIIS